MSKQCRKFFLILLFSVFSIPLFAAINIADFARFNEFDDVRISPDGSYLAAGMNDAEGKRSVVIINLKTRRVTAKSSFSRRSRPGGFFWANKERLIITLSTNLGSLDFPISTGELYAVNVDGKRAAMIYGYRATARKSEKTYAGARLLDVMKDDPKHILVSVTPYPKYRGDSVLTQAVKLNIYNGKAKRIALTPIRNGRLLADNNQHVRLAIGNDASNGNGNGNVTKIYYRQNKSDKYRIIGEYGQDSDGGITPLRFTPDNQKIYISSDLDSDTQGFYLLDPKTGKKELLADDDSADLQSALFDNDDRLIAVIFYKDKAEYQFIGNSPFKKSIRGLAKAFSGNELEILNQSWDGKYFTLKVKNDRNPGDFYLYNTKTHKANFLMTARSWQDPEQLRPVKPISFTASDGLKIHGYLTRPDSAGPYPLVVLPHGGPFGIRDHWAFDPEVQLLATAGYAVLQVNYRGSDGYGKKFQKLGIGEWGADMQQDLTDATHWAMDQGFTRAGKICIFGGSYGAYAALMGVVNEPDLYRCAVGYAGVYDLNLMFDEGDISWNSAGINYLEFALGKDEKVRAAHSPVNHASVIKASLFLAHGGEDERAPIEQYEALEKALKKAGKPFKSLVFKREGHGFFKQKNREEFYTELLEFLDENISS